MAKKAKKKKKNGSWFLFSVIIFLSNLSERIKYTWLQPEHAAWKNFSQSIYHIYAW